MTKFKIIAGPCVIETRDLTRRVAASLAATVTKLQRDYEFECIFKASLDKANRTSNSSYRGDGIQYGLGVLDEIKRDFGLRITTDIHETYQAPLVKGVVDVIQIPAFLCRQTDLLAAAAQTGRIINVKKGQFLAPWDMEHVATKLRGAGEIWFTERGTTFGYGRLVNDMTGIPIMQRWAPVIFDATHSVQEPGGLGHRSGGHRDMVETLARAAVAAGCDGLFLETHPDPDKAPSDGPNMVSLTEFPALLRRLLSLREAVMRL